MVPRSALEYAVIHYMPLLESKYDSQKMEKEKREAWHDKFYNFIDLKKTYIEHAKEVAPRTYSAKVACRLIHRTF